MSGMGSVMAGAKRLWPGQLIRSGAVNMRLVWMGLLGILLLAAGGIMDYSAPGKSKVEPVPSQVQNSAPTAVSRPYEEALEAKLANLLSQVKGAGSVAVNVTLESGPGQEYAQNVVRENRTVQEKDTSGGIRTTTESKETDQIILGKENGADRPVMVKETKPVIKGVLVVAEGAGDSIVKANLTKAVEAGLGIPSYKISVLPQRR